MWRYVSLWEWDNLCSLKATNWAFDALFSKDDDRDGPHSYTQSQCILWLSLLFRNVITDIRFLIAESFRLYEQLLLLSATSSPAM